MTETHLLIALPARVLDTDTDGAALWNRDPATQDLGTATAPGAAAAFPIDPGSAAGMFLLAVASGVTTAAIIEGVKALLRPHVPPATTITVAITEGDVKTVTVQVTPPGP